MDTTDTDDDTAVEDTDHEVVGDASTVVHLSPDAPGVDLYVNGETAGVDGVTFPAGSGYLVVPAAEYTFEVAPAGTTHDDVVPVGLTATLETDKSYTAIAHGYLDSANGSNGFAITPFVDNTESITDGNFRVHVIHAAAADAFAQVDIWNLTDPNNHLLLSRTLTMVRMSKPNFHWCGLRTWWMSMMTKLLMLNSDSNG